MSNPITEQELAEIEGRTNKAWQESIDRFRKEYPASEAECVTLLKIARLCDLPCAGQIFSAAMMKLHVLSGEDLEETDNGS